MGPDDFILTFSERCEAATSLDALAQLLFEAAGGLGFLYAACGSHIGPGTSPFGAFIVHNFPAEWAERFRRKQYLRIDPVLRYAERNRTAFSWDAPAFLQSLTERQSRLLNEARAFRVAHGYTIPVSHDLYLPASCTLISETGDIDPAALAIAKAIIFPLYYRAALLARDGRQPMLDGRLSPRERECLALKAQGFSDTEIAAKLGISISTVCRHIELAKSRLGARSREHAVSLAIESRQIK